MKTKITLVLSENHAIAFDVHTVSLPKSKRTTATQYAFGNSYRRVHKDKGGLYAIWYGKRVKAFMTTQAKLGGM